MEKSQPLGGKKKLIAILFGLFIAILNIAAIVMGFTVCCIVRPMNQLLVQLPVAFVFSVSGVVLIALLFRKSRVLWIDPDSAATFLIIFFASLLWAPVLFVPLHFAVRGYLTSFANILGLWSFQIPANFVALLFIWRHDETTSKKCEKSA